MKKNVFWIVATAILVVICIFLFFRSCSNDKSLKNDFSKQQDSLTAIKDSLQKAYNECAGVMTPEERIAFLESKVSDLEKRKPIVNCRIIRPRPKSFRKFVPTKFTPKLDVTEKKFEPTFSPKPVSRAVETSTEKPAPTENNLVTQYQGVMTGDYGTTIDNESGKIVYFLRNSFVKNNGGDEAPRLNGKNGEKFSYNSKTGYWYYVDGQIMTVGEVNSWAYAREWNVYIGQTDYGVGSYETYLPHQALKPLINQARGKEWGEVTDEDLYKMRKLNSSIWTPTNEGTLRPFRLNKDSGRALGKEDRQLYQGWNFRTRIVVIKK